MLNQLLASLANTKMECVVQKIDKILSSKNWRGAKTVMFSELEEMCTQLT